MTVEEALEIICQPFDTCHRCGRRVVMKRCGMPVCDTAWCEAVFPGGEGLCPSAQQIWARARVLRELARAGVLLESPTERYAERLIGEESLRRIAAIRAAVAKMPLSPRGKRAKLLSLLEKGSS